jgi:hypothetical protein
VPISDRAQSYTLGAGNPVDDLPFAGPFETRAHAEAHGERVGDAEWWIVPLLPPEAT